MWAADKGKAGSGWERERTARSHVFGQPSSLLSICFVLPFAAKAVLIMISYRRRGPVKDLPMPCLVCARDVRVGQSRTTCYVGNIHMMSAVPGCLDSLVLLS